MKRMQIATSAASTTSPSKLQKLFDINSNLENIAKIEQNSYSWLDVAYELLSDSEQNFFHSFVQIKPEIDNVVAHDTDFNCYDSLDYVLVLGLPSSLDLSVFCPSASKRIVPFALDSSKYHKPLRTNFEIDQFSEGKTFFLGQLAFYYDVYIVFTPHLKKDAYIAPVSISSEEAETLYGIVGRALANLSGRRILQNGIIADYESNNLKDEKTWEFDDDLLKKFSDEFELEYLKSRNSAIYGTFLKTHFVQIAVFKYGQNFDCDQQNHFNVACSIVEWFDLQKCSALFLSLAKNYFTTNHENTCALFQREILEKHLGQKVDFYSKAFCSYLGNFQTSSCPKIISDIMNEKDSIIQQLPNAEEKQYLHFHGLQGYSSTKKLFRKRKWEEPFFTGQLTKVLSIPASLNGKKGTKSLEEIYNGSEFKKSKERVVLASSKNHELRVEICMSIDVDLLSKNAESAKIVMFLMDACNSSIEAAFDFNNFPKSELPFVLLPTSIYPGILHLFLGFFQKQLDPIIKTHKEKGFLTLGQKELVSLLERLLQFMFSGDVRKLPSILMKQLGTAYSLNTCNFPYINENLVNFDQGNMNFLDAWKSNMENMRFYHLALLPKAYGSQKARLLETSLQIELLIDLVVKGQKTEQEVLYPLASLFMNRLTFAEFMEDFKETLIAPNDDKQEAYQQLIEEIELCQENNQIIQLGYIRDFNDSMIQGSISIESFVKSFFDCFMNDEGWAKRLARKTMIFPQNLLLISEFFKQTHLVGFRDFIKVCISSLNNERVEWVPKIQNKIFKPILCSAIIMSSISAENSSKKQLFALLEPFNCKVFDPFMIPMFHSVFNSLVDKFPQIRADLFAFFDPQENETDAAVFIKCCLLGYRFFIRTTGKTMNSYVVDQNGTHLSATGKIVYSLVLYSGIKLKDEQIILVFKDKKGIKNVAHTKVKLLLIIDQYKFACILGYSDCGSTRQGIYQPINCFQSNDFSKTSFQKRNRRILRRIKNR